MPISKTTTMGASPNYSVAPPSMNQQQNHAMNLSMLYYSFFVVATAGVLLTLYHCLVINWCANRSWLRSNEPVTGTIQISDGQRQKVMQLDSTMFRYKKGQDEGSAAECAVCLSAYEEGEHVRKLLRCNHCFHAPCIDMWLYSHFDCPLCRAPVGDPKGIASLPGISTAGFSDPSMLV